MILNINGINWKLIFVSPYSEELKRSDGSYTYGVTDANKKCIYVSNKIFGKFMKKVLCHEIVHAYIISNDIYLPIETEEYICSSIAEYGDIVLKISNEVCKNIKKCNCGE